MPRLLLVPIVVLVFAIAPCGAAAAPRQWATVNLCNPVSAPHSMGVRASMSGNGRLARMYMRFRAQYILPGKRRWRAVNGAGGVSPWINLGRARTRTEQAGWNFEFEPPAAGSSFRARGIVEFQWRAKRRRPPRKPVRWAIVKRRRAVTRGGIAAVDGGDPPGTSIASCLFA